MRYAIANASYINFKNKYESDNHAIGVEKKCDRKNENAIAIFLSAISHNTG
ncbi:hypothetical protein FDUTEX481_06847 [Tolypothrix sp. PCC 7601]|nr:hypothetical protein FDUTEX481_06847 [Tolypothrix sp. PCC 7601]